MKVRDMSVNWWGEYGNAPEFNILVDRIPNMNELRFSECKGIWFAEKDGYVDFYYWRGPENEGGYGGHIFPITMHDGKAVNLLGPWSSGSDAVNGLGCFTPCIEASIEDNAWRWSSYHKRGSLGGSVTVQLILDNIERFLPYVTLVRVTNGHRRGPYYIPTLNGIRKQIDSDSEAEVIYQGLHVQLPVDFTYRMEGIIERVEERYHVVLR